MNKRPATYTQADDVQRLLEEHRKKTGVTHSFVINEAVRQYFKKLKNK